MTGIKVPSTTSYTKLARAALDKCPKGTKPNDEWAEAEIEALDTALKCLQQSLVTESNGRFELVDGYLVDKMLFGGFPV